MSTQQEPGYERSDARPGGVFGFAVGLTVVITVVMFAMSALFGVLEARVARDDSEGHPLAGEVTTPSPRLQAFPAQELSEYRAVQRELTETYGLIDVQLGVYRIPVDRAMELVVERGLPVRTQPAGGVRGVGR